MDPVGGAICGVPHQSDNSHIRNAAPTMTIASRKNITASTNVNSGQR